MAKPLTTPEFEAALAGLNPEQREAVDTIDGPVFVIAGPGTGKTQVLTLRIANILAKTDTPPEAILALTFTESGAAEMRERLTRFMGGGSGNGGNNNAGKGGASRAAKVRFHTFHGFAENLVSRYPDSFPHIVSAQIAIDAERAEILEEAINTATLKYLRPYGDPMHYHYDANRAISTFKRENITPEILATKIAEAQADFDAIPDKESTRSKPLPNGELKLQGKYIAQQKKIDKTQDLLEVYKLYEELLKKRERYDYDDLILETVRALSEDDSFRTEVQESFFYILADEHQDANGAQNRILELLVDYTDNPNLFIVGDEKQAIYRFQGADLDNVQYFRDHFKNTKVIVLKENYRSPQNVLDTALSLIAASKDERLSRLPLTAQKRAAEESIQKTTEKGKKKAIQPITLAACANADEEVDFLVERITALHAGTGKKSKSDQSKDKSSDSTERGVPYEDIAILVRTNKIVLQLSERLTIRDIPVTTGTEDALNNRFVMALVRLLTYIAEPSDENSAGVLMLPGFLFSPADATRLMRYAHASRISMLDVLEKEIRMKDAQLSEEGMETGKRFYTMLKELSREAALERPAIVAKDAFKVSGLLDMILSAPDRSESLAAIRAFLTLAEDLSAREHTALLPRFLAVVSLYHERGILLPAPPQEYPGYVKLMTVHKAKGREFPYVFMPVLTDRVWNKSPDHHFTVPGILTEGNELEDERRLLYVGITRAKEHVTLSYPRARENGRSEVPFELLDDLDPALVEKITFEKTSSQANDSPELVFLREGKKKTYSGILEPTEDDYKALTEALFAQGLSPSALNNYLCCPWKYFYQSLLRIPSAEKGYLTFGTAMHYAFEQYAYKRGRDEHPGVEYLIDRFEQKLSHSPLTDRDIAELQKRGREALPLWLAKNEYSWPEKCESEVSLSFEFLLHPGKSDSSSTPESILLKGKLDRVDALGGSGATSVGGTGSGDRVRVIDYKTGEQHSRNHIMGKTADSNGDMYRQLTFYKMLLANTEPPRFMTEGVIEFVEPNDAGELRTEAFEISDAEVTELEELIRKTVQDIRTLSFWNEPCEDKECEWCPLRFGLAVE